MRLQPPSLPSISEQIWDMKYRLKAVDGSVLDHTLADTWARVAKAVAAAEPRRTRKRWQKAFAAAMADFAFLPAGRILAGAGTERDVTLFNCFVMGRIEDDLGSIFENVKEAALTMQQGGGIGHDFSTLRPKGALVRSIGADASGPVSFMDVWDAMCRTIMSAGARRGAMMATLRCDHPDIEAFIDAKADAARLRNFNLSVLVTDAFVRAVRNDEAWPLVFAGKTTRTVQARTLWDRIMRATYDYAEPGVVFIDRINEKNPIKNVGLIEATNPCVTADTWVQTASGPRQVHELVGQPFVARLDLVGRYRRRAEPVRRLPHAPGNQDPRRAHGAPLRQRHAHRRLSREASESRARDLPGAGEPPAAPARGSGRGAARDRATATPTTPSCPRDRRRSCCPRARRPRPASARRSGCGP